MLKRDLFKSGKESQGRGKLLSKPPRDTSIKAEHMSLLKEIREQLNGMQSEMRSLRSELHLTQPVSSHREEDGVLNSIQEVITPLST